MKVLNRFTIKSLRLNKKRTITTIIGIMLSTALICGVAGLVSSFQNTLISWAKEEIGDFHVEFENIEKDKLKYITENQEVEEFYTTSELGWAKLEGSKNDYKPYVHVLEYDEKALEKYDVNLIKGRLPKKPSELVISEHILTNARVELNLGDKLALNLGERVSQDGKTLNRNNPYNEDENESINIMNEKVYTIVGIMNRSRNEGHYEAGYTCVTYKNATNENTNVFVKYKNPKKYKEINANILQNIEKTKEDTTVNSELLRYQGVMSYGALKAVYAIAGIVMFIIVISSVFVIRNSFSISVAEKNKQYGMLSSVGATSKQIRGNVIFEGLCIALIAIPLGIICGVVAIMILLEIVNYLLADSLSKFKFAYSIEPISITISIIISLLTIYLSCLIPAIRASKISPVESIRGNNDVKIKAKKLKTFSIVKKMFGIGGVIASKNLKRSRKKYRTTVVSIVVSIFIFISLSTFLNLGTKSSMVYYTDYKFNMYVTNGSKELYEDLAKLENVDDYAYYYTKGLNVDSDAYYTEFWKKNSKDANVSMVIYNNDYFKKYITELGMNEKDYDRAMIFIDDVMVTKDDGSKKQEKIFNIHDGDKIKVKVGELEKELTIAKCTSNKPMGLEATYYGDVEVVVSEDYVTNTLKMKIDEEFFIEDLCIKSNKSQELENKINDLIKEDEKYQELRVENYDTYVAQTKRMLLVVKIFLYGFITVITLIGVTNIFNTITTNMILRSKEFAMLKSIGMTTKEFNKMIRLESIMYGAKSLFIGIPLGLAGSYAVYKAFANSLDMGYDIPVTSIIISIVFVFIIIGVTMKYSLNKINKQNIIETIREENI